MTQYGSYSGGYYGDRPQFSGYAPVRRVMTTSAPLRVIEPADADALVR